MRDVLAERLLATVMGWTPENVAAERPTLEMLADFKYDGYQQFSPGMRFVESLALWLDQFDGRVERKIAYDFICSRLVFISSAEMAHLVAIAFPDFIRPFLIRQVATRTQTPEIYVTRIFNSVAFRVLLRQSLFLGLSDGARTDLFRRNNPEISHEQVLQTYEIPETKASDLITELRSDLSVWLKRSPNDTESRFRILFLLDDFSGSGLSYLRKEPEEHHFAGKIYRILHNINSGGVLSKVVDLKSLHICLVLYVAASQGLTQLHECMDQWLRHNGNNLKYTIMPIQILPDSIKLHPKRDKHMFGLLGKYFDSSILDKHYRKGSHDEPHLGFDQCALPLVLSHNTPNNTIPILWFEKHRKCRGLFPRVSRHRRA